MDAKSMKNVLVGAGGLPARNLNAPAQSADRQTQYLDPATLEFTKQYARYASDYVVAEAQGLDPDDWTKWMTVYMRMAGVVSVAASMTRRVDAYKQILVASRNIEYVQPGCKFVTMGSTWLAINPENITGSTAVGLVEKCNAVWHYLDYYGNVCSEPMAISSALARANASNPQDTMRITQNYFNVKCQYNDATKQLDENSRLIFGRKAYRISGFSDFDQEFTEDEDSVRMLEFTVRVDETNDAADDMVRRIAGGLTFRWDVDVTGASALTEGGTAQMTAVSQRCGEDVESTEEHPVRYLWTSGDESVATVDQDGLVTAVSAGTTVICAALSQNPDVTGSLTLTVEEVPSSGTVLLWTDEPPEILRAYHTATLSVNATENGTDISGSTVWTVAGGEAGSFSVTADGAELTLSCWKGSPEPVTVTAACGGQTLTAEIALAGV